MAFALLRSRGGTLRLSTALLRSALWMGLCAVVTGELQSECPLYTCRTPPDLFTTKHSGGDTPCYPYGTALKVECQIGFTRSEEDTAYIAVCGVDGEWEWSDSCKIDILSVTIAGIVASVVVCVFFVIIACICSKIKPTRMNKNDREKMIREANEETA